MLTLPSPLPLPLTRPDLSEPPDVLAADALDTRRPLQMPLMGAWFCKNFRCP